MNQGERLARVQLAGHRAIDALAAPLAAQVDEIVRRHATFGRRLIDPDLRLALIGTEPLFTAVIINSAREAERVADPVGNVDTLALTQASRIVSESLAKNRSMVVSQAMRLVQRGISLGMTVVQTAQTVRQYFFRRDPATGLIQSWPGQANMATQHVRGLMLFATTEGHFRGMKRAAFRDEGLLHYHVSHKHLEIDECDLLERQDVGFGGGIYPPDAAPSVPRHFRCRCWYEPADRPIFFTQSESVSA